MRMSNSEIVAKLGQQGEAIIKLAAAVDYHTERLRRLRITCYCLAASCLLLVAAVIAA